MALVGNTFYATSGANPGAGFPMYYWNQTDTGNIYIRNSGDTDWILVGNSDSANLGTLALGGGNMNGAITGAHGLSPASANDFTSSLRVGGLNVATQSYVDTQDSALAASIATEIASSISSIPALSLSSKVTFAKGLWSFTGTATGKVIDRPFYSDGIQAAESECLWFTYWYKITHGFYGSGNLQAIIEETSNRVYNLTLQKPEGTLGFDGIVGWVIVAFRKTS